MANEERVQRFRDLKTAVNSWADVEQERLRDQSAFLQSIRGTAERISSQTTTKAAQLAEADVGDFIKL